MATRICLAQMNQTVATPDSSADKKYEMVEVMPEYPGGEQAMIKFLSTNIKYPKKARKHDFTGKVIVQFIIDKDGSVTDAHIIKSVDPLLDAEAMRVIQSMPKWKPGMQNNKTVKVIFKLPINFKLED